MLTRAVRRHLLVGPVQIRLVAAGLAHAGLGVIRRHDLRPAAEELEGVEVRAEPIRQGLPSARLGEGVAGGAQHGQEDRNRTGSPVWRSQTGTVSPAQSTNTFRPARCCRRNTTSCRERHRWYSSQKRL